MHWRWEGSGDCQTKLGVHAALPCVLIVGNVSLATVLTASLKHQMQSLNFAGIPRRRQLFSHRPRAASGETGAAGTAAVVAGAVANPLVLYSLFVLKSTGSGLPPGPYGLYGAAEGVSYLIVVGLVGWSIATKVPALYVADAAPAA